jgi:hypothetical protein
MGTLLDRALGRSVACASCGRQESALRLDAKPSSERYQREAKAFGQTKALALAADRGDQFDRLECESCYGPGYSEI